MRPSSKMVCRRRTILFYVWAQSKIMQVLNLQASQTRKQIWMKKMLNLLTIHLMKQSAQPIKFNFVLAIGDLEKYILHQTIKRPCTYKLELTRRHNCPALDSTRNFRLSSNLKNHFNNPKLVKLTSNQQQIHVRL